MLSTWYCPYCHCYHNGGAGNCPYNQDAIEKVSNYAIEEMSNYAGDVSVTTLIDESEDARLALAILRNDLVTPVPWVLNQAKIHATTFLRDYFKRLVEDNE